MKIFLTCPIHGISSGYREEIESQVEFLKRQGHIVDYPFRDTNQPDPSELQVDHFKAIENADEVYIVWDGKSQGVLLDIGMAWGKKKRVTTIDEGTLALIETINHLPY